MNFIRKYIFKFDLDPSVAEYLSIFINILFIAIICIVANFITKKVVIRIITHIVTNNKVQWDDMLLERKVFHELSQIVPAIIIFYFSSNFPSYQHLIQKSAIAYLIIVGLWVLNSLLNAINDIYQTHEISKVKPIKGYIQVSKIIVIVVGIIIVIANLIGESPFVLLSGIGALSAVFLLVFKDTLLGLVAGIQLTAHNMVRVGDWIEMPKYGADGNIIEISLNTVKIQNFDNTITTFPTYALISDSFKNWTAMQASGGRRIKRALLIDTNRISICTEEMIDRYKTIHYLSDYIINREREITEFNSLNELNRSNPVNGKSLTNIGVFRAYISNYLKNHPGINQEMSLMVRPLAPTENGLPLEIYAFTNDVRWAVYEAIQAEIFDHLFAVVKEFDLRLFQNPSGHDFKAVVDLSKRKVLIEEIDQ
ncbi:mechanosensitive ion channel [Cytobacillus depressus]|uniref:Mechanosensing system component YbdG n=1 Tax=Cytobacillus depressus TaxID=1602942 RepID=A0A6L3V238_9BACI|nr:mechanosensitive ion channel domain-containing protein [Cytobacillus depressus]KAB2332270.1 mechanosensitive ion channel [Cytobacillus depressus]